MKKRKWPVLLAALCLLAVWCARGVWVSYHDPVVRRWEVPLDTLTVPVRAAVLADLHDRDFDEGNQTLLDLTAAAEPDLILLAGDLLNDVSPDSHVVTELVENLTAIAPVYFAWGNHELDYMAAGHEALAAEVEAAGAVILEKNWVDLTVNGAELRLGGLYGYAFAQDDHNTCDPARMDPEVYQFLTDYQDTDRCKVLLSHRPDSFALGEASATWEVDLVISGHDHGGQVVLPLLGGLYGGDQGFFPEYVHGIYEKDNIRLAITSGLGSQQQRLPRFRNPPEIMVLDLTPGT